MPVYIPVNENEPSALVQPVTFKRAWIFSKSEPDLVRAFYPTNVLGFLEGSRIRQAWNIAALPAYTEAS